MRMRLDRLTRDVTALAAAAKRFDDRKAGAEAVRRLRVFFLDDATKAHFEAKLK